MSKQELLNKDRLMTDEESDAFLEQLKKAREKNKHVDPIEHLLDKMDDQANVYENYDEEKEKLIDKLFSNLK